MCKECGCGEEVEVKVERPILDANEQAAQHNREHLERHGVYGVELLGSPGAGKTTLLEVLVERLGLPVAVVEGDIETQRDAERIRAKGVPAFQLTTGGACHLDARLVHGALHHLPLDEIKVLFIENVGNLVCPASFRLGAHERWVLLSTPEGDDKPAKYPKAFREASVLVITKMDLAEAMGFDPQRAVQEALSLNPYLKVFLTSAKTGEGIEQLAEYLRERVK